MDSTCISTHSPPILLIGSRGEGDGRASGFFAAGLIYGQVKKVYRRRRLVRVTPIMRCSPRAALKAVLIRRDLSGTLNTAFIERLNLRLRQSVAALVRRTWSRVQDVPQLLLQLEWWRA
jgi:hypothetical protein